MEATLGKAYYHLDFVFVLKMNTICLNLFNRTWIVSMIYCCNMVDPELSFVFANLCTNLLGDFFYFTQVFRCMALFVKFYLKPTGVLHCSY